MGDVALLLGYYTMRFLLPIFSFGLVRVESLPGETSFQKPEFGWLNVLWKRDGKTITLSEPFATFLGLFIWTAALTALVAIWQGYA